MTSFLFSISVTFLLVFPFFLLLLILVLFEDFFFLVFELVVSVVVSDSEVSVSEL